MIGLHRHMAQESRGIPEGENLLSVGTKDQKERRRQLQTANMRRNRPLSAMKSTKAAPTPIRRRPSSAPNRREIDARGSAVRKQKRRYRRKRNLKKKKLKKFAKLQARDEEEKDGILIPRRIWERLDLGVRRRLIKDSYYKNDKNVREFSANNHL